MTARRKPSASNVVSLRPEPKKETTEDIVRDVQGRAAAHSEAISRQLKELVARAQALHRERAEELLPIGVALDRSRLDDLIEIGERMLRQQGYRL